MKFWVDLACSGFKVLSVHPRLLYWLTVFVFEWASFPLWGITAMNAAIPFFPAKPFPELWCWAILSLDLAFLIWKMMGLNSVISRSLPALKGWFKEKTKNPLSTLWHHVRTQIQLIYSSPPPALDKLWSCSIQIQGHDIKDWKLCFV